MKVVSLFSGAGGLDLGFIKAGHQVIWANDIYTDAVETYRRNIGNHIIAADIHSIPSHMIPQSDIVIGGFPCQGFSVANTKRNIEDNRNKLYQELLRVIKDKSPKFFIAENVKGILSLGKGTIFSMILDDLSFNYKVSYALFNTADYGVPQLRERVIIAGVRKDIKLEYSFPVPTHSRTGLDGKHKWISSGEAVSIFPNPDTPNDIPNHIYSKYKLNFNGYLGHRKLDPSLPAPTVTARGDDKGGVVILPHPNNKRRMTCRELATIQSFPINFEFYGNKSSIYRQIANAVPVEFAYCIAMQFNRMKHVI